MSTPPKSDAEDVVHILSRMILGRASAAASEQYGPRMNPDDSDAYIEENKRWVKELRDIRERLENLFTGILK